MCVGVCVCVSVCVCVCVSVSVYVSVCRFYQVRTLMISKFGEIQKFESGYPEMVRIQGVDIPRVTDTEFAENRDFMSKAPLVRSNPKNEYIGFYKSVFHFLKF